RMIPDELHQWLLQGYHYRIMQALNHEPHGGPLPSDLLGAREPLDKFCCYVVNRARAFSRILEPDVVPDPYSFRWGKQQSPLLGELAEIEELRDAQEIAERFHRVLRETTHGEESPATCRKPARLEAAVERVQILRAALNQAPLVGPEFARTMV